MIDEDAERRAKAAEYARNWRAAHRERNRDTQQRYWAKHRKTRPEPPGFSREYSPPELAYAAGILDGEGNLHIAVWKSSFLPVITITNTDHRLAEWFTERFEGGGIHGRQRENPVHKVAWDWRLSGKRATAFAALLLPYLVLKRPQAELLISYYDEGTFHWGNRPLPPEVRDRRRQMHEAMKAMNKRGKQSSLRTL